MKEYHDHDEAAEHPSNEPDERRTLDDKELHHGIHGDYDPHKWNINKVLDDYKDGHQVEHGAHVTDEEEDEQMEERDSVKHDRNHQLETLRVHTGSGYRDNTHALAGEHQPHSEHHRHTIDHSSHHKANSTSDGDMAAGLSSEGATSRHSHSNEMHEWVNAKDMSDKDKLKVEHSASDMAGLTKKHFNYDTGDEMHNKGKTLNFHYNNTMS